MILFVCTNYFIMLYIYNNIYGHGCAAIQQPLKTRTWRVCAMVLFNCFMLCCVLDLYIRELSCCVWLSCVKPSEVSLILWTNKAQYSITTIMPTVSCQQPIATRYSNVKIGIGLKNVKGLEELHMIRSAVPQRTVNW